VAAPEPKLTLIQDRDVEPTPDAILAEFSSLIADARLTWSEAVDFRQKRDHARLRMCWQAAEILASIGDYDDSPAIFDQLCQDQNARGNRPENQIIDMITRDGDRHISDERRAEYGAAVMWFSKRCKNRLDEDGALREAHDAGGIVAIADLYRHPEGKPSVAARIENVVERIKAGSAVRSAAAAPVTMHPPSATEPLAAKPSVISKSDNRNEQSGPVEVDPAKALDSIPLDGMFLLDDPAKWPRGYVVAVARIDDRGEGPVWFAPDLDAETYRRVIEVAVERNES
jgi:hypothetical protein